MRIISSTTGSDGQPDRRPGSRYRAAIPTGTGPRARRTTRQGLAVTALLAELRDFRSAQEIHAALQERGDDVGIATVYRNLALLAEAGDVDVLTREDGETVYLHCSRQHHHHLVCRACGHAIEITGPGVETWADELAERYGYTDVSHILEAFGLCPECSRASTSTSSRPASADA